jgi:hypothetical protein
MVCLYNLSVDIFGGDHSQMKEHECSHDYCRVCMVDALDHETRKITQPSPRIFQLLMFMFMAAALTAAVIISMTIQGCSLLPTFGPQKPTTLEEIHSQPIYVEPNFEWGNPPPTPSPEPSPGPTLDDVEDEALARGK